jgi:hypothetical protein
VCKWIDLAVFFWRLGGWEGGGRGLAFSEGKGREMVGRWKVDGREGEGRARGERIDLVKWR